MSIQNERQLEKTEKKLRLLEEHYAEAKQRPAENARVRELTSQSLKRTINQLTEEIVRYRVQRTTEKRS